MEKAISLLKEMGAETTLFQQPMKDHLHSLWYGGAAASVRYKGYTFNLSADGEVRAWLYDTDGHLISDVTDKSSRNGRFNEEMRSYIKNDEELMALIRGDSERTLDLGNNNWWEVTIYDPDGNYYDMEWCCEADFYNDALEEIATSADEMIDRICERV